MTEFLKTGDRNSTPGAVFSRDKVVRFQDKVVRFQTPCRSKALWQLVNSVVPYVLLWIAMVYALKVSYWLVVPLAILAAGFLARIFIIFHDCGHASFFESKRANRVTGTIAAFLNLTPYRHWRWQHALHHGTSGDLDRRGAGDIWILTVQEYLESTRWKRAAYRPSPHHLPQYGKKQEPNETTPCTVSPKQSLYPPNFKEKDICYATSTT